MNPFPHLTVSNIEAVYRMNLLSMRPSRTERRPHNALYLKLEGKTVYESNGKEYVCDPEHVVFLPSGCSYLVRMVHPGECFRVEFDSIGDLPNEICSIRIRNPLDLQNRLARLENIWLFKKQNHLPRAMAELYALLAQLSEMVSAASSEDVRQKKLEPAMRYLEKHYSDSSLRIDRLAAEAGISEAYFRRLFLEVYHVTPVQYIRNVRIEKAKALLTGGSGTMEEIACEAGFSSVYHFSRTFHQVSGETPSEYARKF